MGSWWTRVLVFVLAVDGLILASPALARTRIVEVRGQEIPIRLAPGQTTEIIFSEPIRQVVTSVGKDALSLETVGARLYLAPLASGLHGTIFVLLESDRSVPLALLPAEPSAPPDLSVRVLSPQRDARAQAETLQGLTPLRLLRAMLGGQEFPGVKVARAEREVYNDQAVRLTLYEVWRAPQLEGNLLIAENLHATWIRLPLERIHFPGLLAVHAESEVLAPQPNGAEAQLAGRHRTRVFLVRVP